MTTTTTTTSTEKAIVLCDPASKGERFANTLFFRKLLALAADKVELLCEENQLNVPPRLVDLVWVLVHHIIVDRVLMLVDRHLDTIILCSIYAVCKIGSVEPALTFRRIIAVYMARWDQNSAKVVKAVHCGPDQPPINIIEFYNKSFISNNKNFIINEIKPHCTGGSAELESVFNVTPMPRRPALSPRKVSLSSNVYISPMKDGTKRGIRARASPSVHPGRASSIQARMTPQTKALYAFGESPRKHLEAMNHIINSASGSGSVLPGTNFIPVQGSGGGNGRRKLFSLASAPAPPTTTPVIPSNLATILAGDTSSWRGAAIGGHRRGGAIGSFAVGAGTVNTTKRSDESS